MPEYPEFAWTEALVNAIAHREYALEGAYIQVNMFDNRLEIISPGKLPNIVTIDNIQHTRYSRNPHISRVLVDFGWVRELNEGVRRIFADMKASALSEPTYSEPDQRYVQIILHNGYENQKAEAQHIHDLTTHLLQREDLDTLERDIMLHLTKISRLKLREIMQLTGKSRNTVSKRIKNLLSKGLINTVGDINSPTRYYCAKPTIEQVTRQN